MSKFFANSRICLANLFVEIDQIATKNSQAFTLNMILNSLLVPTKCFFFYYLDLNIYSRLISNRQNSDFLTFFKIVEIVRKSLAGIKS